MSDTVEQPENPVQEQRQDQDERHRTLLPRLSAFTPEQAQELAQMQVQRVVVFTGNFLTATITVFSTALGLVTGLAWNAFMTNWLQNSMPFTTFTPLDKVRLFYAIGVTLLTVIFVFIVSFVNRRNDWLQRRLDSDRNRE